MLQSRTDSIRAHFTGPNPVLRPILVSLNFHYLVHAHEETLRSPGFRISVLATAEAAATVRPWEYFTDVFDTRYLDRANPDWRALHRGGPLSDLQVVGETNEHHVSRKGMVDLLRKNSVFRKITD